MGRRDVLLTCASGSTKPLSGIQLAHLWLRIVEFANANLRFKKQILYKTNGNQINCKIVEAYFMHVNSGACINQTFISLHDKKTKFLNGKIG